jgi:hypothetical protein
MYSEKKAEAPDHQLLEQLHDFNMAASKPVKPGILALTPKASRCWQVFWLTPPFEPPSHLA